MDLPWGNMGVSMGAICAAGIYNKMGADTKVRTEAACFIEEQLAYTTNHKCSRKGEACNTGTTAGYSYIVGCAQPLRLPADCPLGSACSAVRCPMLFLHMGAAL